MSWDYKFTLAVPLDAEEELTFASELGYRYIFTNIKEDDYSLKTVKSLVGKAAARGLTYSTIRCFTKPCEVFLNLPGRDETLKKMEEYLHIIAEAGVKAHTMTWEPDRVWSTNEERYTRGCRTRYVNLAELTSRPLTHGRIYSREELWDNFAYFSERLSPVYEKLGITLVLHPNDPPTDSLLGGCPCLIRGLDDYKKAFGIFGRNLGMEFCCGCWLEGRSEMMGDVVEDLDWCLRDGRVGVVHFRTVSGPLPEFTELFPDDGPYDMYKIMRKLCEHDYDGVITFDHIPRMMSGEHSRRAPAAYATGYMRALAERAVAELNRQTIRPSKN